MRTKIFCGEVGRKLLLLSLACFSAMFLLAQNFILNSKNGVSDQFNQVTENQKITFTPSNARELFQLDPNSGLVLVTTLKDDLGFEHHQFYQTYLNIPVEKTMFKVHTKEGFFRSTSGTIVTAFNTLMN